ncbi:24629_t:CDS:2 [Gigaspora margarita]|uniref:24629_t:CDS:1 n=1 Tax=Gigaspora margarita TaxID=4874 RepID=A0ABN7VE60_GIGMA|nr:24629_t:CDS:2 [Gigaspora margarita]
MSKQKDSQNINRQEESSNMSGYEEFQNIEWRKILDKKTNIVEELKIKNAFLKADEIIFSQSETLQLHSDAKYTSQFEIDEIIFSRPETPQRDPVAIYTSQLIIIESKLLNCESQS